ncbi:MAG: glycosyltransferase family 4 protein [Candidatus Yanofskybacteria bacterium]|nr:glycosyltransferase family 4 protein [Candidatus Yanofskybacteria bacterium]
MLKIGIECESIEGLESWGIGRIVKNLLEEISLRPELTSEFRFFLYFKSHIPKLPFLDNPIFVKKVSGVSSFSLYYYLLLPIKLWFEKLDLMFLPNYMLPILFLGKSLVMLTEDIYYEIHTSTLPFRYKLAYKIFAGWWTARHATKIMAISETSKKEMAQLFKINPTRIVVNQLGVDQPKPITNYQLPITNYILYVGQAFPRRHLRETMLAFELISSRFPDLKLVAIGKDKYNPPIIKTLVKEINNRIGKEKIIYKEYVSENELVQLYAHAKLLVYVSSKEAFGLPPLEALGHGVPAVVSDSEISHEIFGDNAFFVSNPDDPNSIAEAITKGLTNETKRQEIKNARQSILTKYTWQKHTDKFLEIIRP